MREEKGAVIFAGVIAADQLAKYLSRLFGFASVNQGISFNLLPHHSIVPLLSLIILIGAAVWHYRSPHFSLLLILAGGLSNFVDRLIWGGVVDFISLPLLPAFNLADVAICLGGFFLIVDLLKLKTIS